MTEEKKKTLQELLSFEKEAHYLLDENGGLITERVGVLMDALERELPEKVDRTRGFLDAVDFNVSRLKAKEKEFRVPRLALESVYEMAKARIKNTMESMGKHELVGADYIFKLGKGKKKILIDEPFLPPEFKKIIVTTTTVVDFEKIEAALERGEKVSGVATEGQFRLLQQTNKGIK